jgi:two-component system chemotaxis sensor kinase CheA
MDAFEREMKATFLEEATQLLRDVEKEFLELEHRPTDSGIIDKLFRLAHNLKGSGKAVGFGEMGDFTHVLESLLLMIKQGELRVSPEIMSILLKCNDHLVKWVELLLTDLSAKVDSSALISVMTDVLGRAATQPAKAVEIAPASRATGGAAASDSIDRGAPKVERVKSPLPERSKGGGGGGWHFAQASKGSQEAHGAHGGRDESIRVSLKRVDTLLNYVGELVIFQTVMTQHQAQIPSALLQKTVGQLAKITKDIQGLSMSLRMVPLNATFQKIQRTVRDTGQLLGKEVHLEISGEDTELDKTVVEVLGDPLVHLVRNALDHGIESPDERARAGKARTGRVSLAAFQRGGKIVIEIRDDGRGLNPEVLRAKAKEKGILNASREMSDEEAKFLIFHPGFSTKTEVTEVSGRGVGMDVVKTNIENLEGAIEIDSTVGEGSCFRILLPLTLAIIDGMVVRIGDEKYVIPISHVHESIQPEKSQIHDVTGMQPMLSLRGESLPLFQLGEALHRRLPSRTPWESTALIFRLGARAYALQVDAMLGQQQVVIKQLGLEVRNTPGLAGAAILGDGKVAMILEMSEIVHALEAGSQGHGQVERSREAA